MPEKIRIKAAKDAPDSVSHGYLYAEKKGGFYETDKRVFADHIVRSGFGEEVAATEPEQQTEAAGTEPAAAADVPKKKRGGSK